MNETGDAAPVDPGRTSPLPLAGLRILDLSWLLPGPFASLLLADLGADVVKVERPQSGDYLRDILPSMFELVNRGKRSIAIDLKDPASLAEFRRLVATADIVMEGFRPGVADRLGVGYDALSAVKPDLVYLSISGYGQTGPYADMPGHDINYLAAAGALSVPAVWGEPPRRSGLPVADLASAMYAALNIVAAIRRRDQTGEGSRIDIAIADSALHWSQVRIAGVDPERPHWHHVHPANDIFETADGRGLSLALVENKFLRNFCLAAGRPDLIETFAPAEEISGDVAGAALLKTELARLVGSRALAEWTRLLAGADVPFAPVNRPSDIEADPHFSARGMTGRMSMPVPGGLGGHLARSHAPGLGEHSDEIRAEMRPGTTGRSDRGTS